MKPEALQSNPTAAFVEQFINQTSQSIFLTGKAGTGKTTLLRKIMASTHKNAVIVAPTGIAALNAGGVTIHSFFQLPFAGFIPEFGAQPAFSESVKFETKQTLLRHFTMNKTRLKMIRNIDLLIIDEVSMLRADLLDAIDWTLRNIRRVHEPFGNVQVLFIGDLLQLPPVVKQEEWQILRNHYQGIFFFHAKVLQETQPLYIELSKIYRQQDQDFIQLLNQLRNNQMSSEDLQILNQYVRPDFDANKEEGYITLSTHNAKADQINAIALEALPEKLWSYAAEITGDYPKHLYPLEPTLELKLGAQVMFIKNDLSLEKNYFNGKMGKIKALSSDEILVEFPEEKKTINVEKFEWSNIRYELNAATGEVEEKTIGTFVHYPLKLAWAITVHKSQGLTFDKAVLDVSEVFAPGQAYVALSRLRTLSGLVLTQPMRMNGLSNDQQVMAYSQHKADENTLPKVLEAHTKHYLLQTLKQAFDWYELRSQWSQHEASYQALGAKSEKTKNKSWIALQNQVVQATKEPAEKFIRQLEGLFTKPHFDRVFLKERVDAAYHYFFAQLDGVLLSNLRKIAELSRVRKTKSYAEELEALDDILTETILKLKKVRLLVSAVAEGEAITKDRIWNNDLQQYKLSKIAIVRQELKQVPSLLDDPDAEEVSFLKSTKKLAKAQKVKKSTQEKTLELLEAGKEVSEIARERQLSVQTINSHFAYLIRSGQIELTDVMSPKRISELEQLFDGFEGNSLNPLKEKLGSKATWDELKLYQAWMQVS
ncbi:MAG: helix-turn-helix domain-containing protein [Flavobacteriia bacterium]